MKKIVIIISLVFVAINMSAQAPNLDSVKQELYKINKVFDSSRYLGFDVHILYSTDTVYGKYDIDEMSGKYILNEKNIYYKMGDIEYVQNDFFTYDIYHDEKLIVMTRDSITSKSKLFPLKDFVDSILAYYSTSYTIALRDTLGSKVIEFNTTDSLAPYRRFAIYYEQTNYYPSKFEIYFIENNTQLQSTDDALPSKKSIVMTFSNYNNPTSLEMFENRNYVFYDRETKRYRPSEKFRMYKLQANGVNGGEDETTEYYSPPEKNQ